MPETIYPPKLNLADTNHLVSLIKDWSIAHGLAVRPPPALVSQEADPHGILATTAPVTLFPSPFPRVCFEQAESIQEAYNALYASISQDEEFLRDIVEQIIEVDDFIAQLWQVHLKVKEEGYVQSLALGLFRSDYMVHKDQDDEDSVPVVKQVEFNTIASSFGGLSFQTSQMHQYLAKGDYNSLIPNEEIKLPNLPKNTSTESLAMGLRNAFESYIKSGHEYTCCILFLVQDPERNVFDQRHLEYALELENPMIPVFRLPFARILAETAISDSPQRRLLYHPPFKPSLTYEVAVVYFRAGYGPQDYPDSSSWQARLQIERSNAIKCPSILTQLAGAKKVQQVLATPTSPSSPSILTRFLPTAPSTTITALEKTFTNIYPLDVSARALALSPDHCTSYVLKPQREGGGNNIYRAAIPNFLRALPDSHWKSYILMEIITPPPLQNMILRNGVVERGGVICELGVYGVCLWRHGTGDVLFNRSAGYLLRTKGDQSEEGGVAAGFGAMDSCLLV